MVFFGPQVTCRYILKRSCSTDLCIDAFGHDFRSFETIFSHFSAHWIFNQNFLASKKKKKTCYANGYLSACPLRNQFRYFIYRFSGYESQVLKKKWGVTDLYEAKPGLFLRIVAKGLFRSWLYYSFKILKRRRILVFF